MAIPEYIRKVPRPVNTVVVDNGKDGPNRYAVRERAGIKYIQNGNPQPKNGKVIGHIFDGAYVPPQWGDSHIWTGHVIVRGGRIRKIRFSRYPD